MYHPSFTSWWCINLVWIGSLFFVSSIVPPISFCYVGTFAFFRSSISQCSSTAYVLVNSSFCQVILHLPAIFYRLLLHPFKHIYPVACACWIIYVIGCVFYYLCECLCVSWIVVNSPEGQYVFCFMLTFNCATKSLLPGLCSWTLSLLCVLLLL